MVHHRLGGRASVGVVLGAMLLAAATGCASNSSGAAKAPSVPGPSSTAASASGATSSAPSATSSSSLAIDQNSPEAQAGIAIYRAMWADVVRVQATMNDQDASLGDHLTGDALTYFHSATHINRLNGYVSAKGEPTLLHPTAKQIVGSGNSAKVLVEDCVDQSSYKLYTSDGTMVSPSSDGHHDAQALVERQSDGSLKVTTFVLNAAGTC
jgi:hypothetical protein